MNSFLAFKLRNAFRIMNKENMNNEINFETYLLFYLLFLVNQ